MRTVPIVTLLACCALAGAVEPELPRQWIDSRYVPGAGRTIVVGAGGDVQGALDAAVPGDTVVLQAGATYVGNFALTAKAGAGWITVRSSDMAGLPAEGVRATRAHAAAMPKLMTPIDFPTVRTVGAAHHWRLIGLEIGMTGGMSYGLVTLGSGSETSAAQLPHDLVIDRCWIHGRDGAQVQNGVRLNSASTAIVDSSIDDCHATAFESHCIGGVNGPGPFKIVNNHLGGATIEVLFGGAVPALPGCVPSDIEFRRNTCSKPLSWWPGHPSYAGTPWYVKNLFELKNAQRVLIEGNVLENNFYYATGSGPDGARQQGYAVLFTCRDEGGAAPHARVHDVTFRHNIVQGSVAGVALWGGEGQGGRRLKIENNLFRDIGMAWGQNDRTGMFIQSGTYPDVQVVHNTVIHDGDILFGSSGYVGGLVVRDNILHHGCARPLNTNWGICGAGTGVGFSTLNGFFGGSPAYVVTRNAMVASPFDAAPRYPAGNWFPGSWGEIGFVGGGDYRLAAGSPFRNAASDGRDLGYDHAALAAAMAPPGSSTPADPDPVPPAPGGGTGSIARQWWLGIPGTAIADLTTHPAFPASPSGGDERAAFEAPTDVADAYGTRMCGYVTAPVAGGYVFMISGDDNCELWLATDGVHANRQRIASVPAWTGPREWSKFPEQRSATVQLAAGQRCYIEALQKEGGGGDSLAVAWQFPNGASEAPIPGHRLTPFVPAVAPPPGPELPPGTGTGLAAEYFDQADLTTHVASRVDAGVEFAWGLGSPHAAVGVDTFSARWRGQVEAIATGTCTFHVVGDDGVRLWVGGRLIVDRWFDQGATEWSGAIDLVAGQRSDIVLEYYENGGDAECRLLWSGAAIAKAAIPSSRLYPAALVPVPTTPPGPTPPAPANLVVNPGFEAGLADWTDQGASIAAPGSGIGGGTALRVGTGAGGRFQDLVGVRGETAYTLAASGRVTAKRERGYVIVEVVDAAGVTRSHTLEFTARSWARQSLTFTTPAGVQRVRVRVWKNAGVGAYLLVDDLDVRAAGTVPTASG
ncbi:MAG TPA: PA14 domain-containing protein [Planctomycetota bacterium]|nr:PA14 domain-containing protein [Planctomycetota bacterium]